MIRKTPGGPERRFERQVSPRTGRRLRAVCTLLVAVALVTTPARRAAADEPGPFSQLVGGLMNAVGDAARAGVLVIFVGIPAVAISGGAFTVHDVQAVLAPPPAVKGWSIAETTVATPLALGFDALTVLLASKELDEVNTVGGGAILVLPAAWLNGLAVHGMWSLAAPRTDTRLLFGASMATGVDLAFTAAAIGSATQRHFGGRAFGAFEMVATAPTIAVGAYELASPGRPYKPAFAGLTAWSGALFAHGIAAVATGVTAERARLRKLYPDNPRFALTPTMLAGGPVPATAFVLGGVW